MITTIKEWKLNENNTNEELINVTTFDFKPLFDEINRDCFNSSLEYIPVEYKKMKNATAVFNFGTFGDEETYKWYKTNTGKFVRCRFIFSTLYEITYDKLRNVFAHEMIHYYLCLNKNEEKAHHGYGFKSHMYRINQLNKGYKITLKDDEPSRMNGLHAEATISPRVFITCELRGRRAYMMMPFKYYDSERIKNGLTRFGIKEYTVYRTVSPYAKLFKSTTKFTLFTMIENREFKIDDVVNDIKNTKIIETIE